MSLTVSVVNIVYCVIVSQLETFLVASDIITEFDIYLFLCKVSLAIKQHVNRYSKTMTIKQIKQEK